MAAFRFYTQTHERQQHGMPLRAELSHFVTRCLGLDTPFPAITNTLVSSSGFFIYTNKEHAMHKSMLMVSVLVAALGSGVALAQKGSGGMGGGQGVGSGSGGMNQGQNAQSGKGNQSAGDAAKKERDRERERERQKLKDGSGNAGNAPFQKRTQEQIRLQENLQP